MSVPQFQQTNVIAGAGFCYLAPAGTALPTLSTMPTDSTWQAAGFVPTGYTDDGVQFTYTPQTKDITVDEEMGPVQVLLIGEKLEISFKMAEVTLNNLLKSIAGASLVLAAGVSTLYLGSPAQSAVQEFVLGFMGPAPGTEVGALNTGRVIVVWRVKSTAAVTEHFQRKDKRFYQVKFTALVDSTQSAGQKLAKIIDYNQAGS
jgi:hypothetical protein